MEKRKKTPYYATGQDFFRELIADYGLEEGVAKAKRYMELPMPKDVKGYREEKLFRDQVLSCIQEYSPGTDSAIIDCETQDCAYNHQGECRFYLVKERKPRITEEDGCLDGCIDPFGAADGDGLACAAGGQA